MASLEPECIVINTNHLNQEVHWYLGKAYFVSQAVCVCVCIVTKLGKHLYHRKFCCICQQAS